MGFIIHFYIIFGTNLLTGDPAQICCFMPISVFRGKGISDRVKTERNQLEKLFLEGKQPRELGVHVRGDTGCPRGWGARRPGRSSLPRGAPVAPPTYPLHPYILLYPKTSRTEDRSGVPPPQASVATKNLSGACSGTLPEGAPERFLVATEACSGGTPDLSSVLEVLRYIGIYGCKGYVGGASRAPRGRGARPRGWAHPPPSWPAPVSSDVESKSIRWLSFQK